MELLKLENVQICVRAADWRDAIRTAALPLEQHGYIEPRYKDEIIANLERLGPYIVIAENVALPHARPEQGAIQTQIGVTLFREPVQFEGKESTARLFITLAARDTNSHLEALVHISELLDQPGMIEKILSAADEETLFRYFQ